MHNLETPCPPSFYQINIEPPGKKSNVSRTISTFITRPPKKMNSKAKEKNQSATMSQNNSRKKLLSTIQLRELPSK
jgi:hypothetical protein